jgi:P2-related tail formation protein
MHFRNTCPHRHTLTQQFSGQNWRKESSQECKRNNTEDVFSLHNILMLRCDVSVL